MAMAPQTSVLQLKQLLDSGAEFCLLDVREPWEVQMAAFPRGIHIPLNEIPRRLKELDAGSVIIVACKVGGRSQLAANFLLSQGFDRVSNLQGGIDAWSREIDRAVPAY